MHHCLNKRRENTYEISETHEQDGKSEKLPQRSAHSQGKLQINSDTRRRSSLGPRYWAWLDSLPDLQNDIDVDQDVPYPLDECTVVWDDDNGGFQN